jgi:hypothetical protein
MMSPCSFKQIIELKADSKIGFYHFDLSVPPRRDYEL